MPDSTGPSIPTTSLTLERDRAFGGSEVSTAVAELPTGVTIRLRIADHFFLINELEGVERKFTLLAYPTSGTRCSSLVDPRVASPNTWVTPWSADFYGIISEISVDPLPHDDTRFHILDVGIGSIYVCPSLRACLSEATPTLQVGDELYVPASVIEVWDVYP